MRKTFKILIIIAIIIIGFGLILWGIKSGSKTDQIKIGVIEPITGQGAGWGNQAKEGALLAEEKIKNDGGNINIYIEDHQNDPKLALTTFENLVLTKNIDALVSMSSGVMVALSPALDEKQIPTINGGAVSNKLSGISKYEFNIVPLSAQDISYIVDQMIDKFGKNKIAILISNDDFGISSGETATKEIALKNAKIVAYEKYLNTDKDFKTQIMKIKNIQPDSLLLAGQAMGLVLKQAKELDLTIPVFSSETFENPDFIKQGGLATEGVIYTGLKLSGDDQAMKNFTKEYKNKYGHEPSLYSYTTYDAVGILYKYLEECNQDKSCVLNKLQNENYSGIYNSDIKFNDKGELVNPEFYLKTVKDGQFVKYE